MWGEVRKSNKRDSKIWKYCRKKKKGGLADDTGISADVEHFRQKNVKLSSYRGDVPDPEQARELKKTGHSLSANAVEVESDRKCTKEKYCEQKWKGATLAGDTAVLSLIEK